MVNDWLAAANPAVQQLQPYKPGKAIAELQRELGLTEIIKLASNENPWGPAPAAIDCVNDVLADLFRYPDSAGHELKQQLSAHYDIPIAQISLGCGSDELIDRLMRCFLGPNKKVIVPQYAFALYKIIATACAAEIVEVPAKDYSADLDTILASIDADTKMICLANPNNPTGTCIDHDALAEFISMVPKSVIVLLDEAYAEYQVHDTYPKFKQLLAQFPNLVVTRTFSKAYGLAAMRVGYAFSNPEIADLINRLRLAFNVNSLALHMATIALREQNYLAEIVAKNIAAREQFVAEFSNRQLEFIPSYTNFLCVDFKRDAFKLFELLLHKGFIVRPLKEYGLPNHLRISFGSDDENTKFFAALDGCLEEFYRD